MEKLIDKQRVVQHMNGRLLRNNVLKFLFFLATLFGLIVLVVLLYRILTQALGWLNMDFLNNFPSRRPENAGIKAGLVGSLWLMVIVAPVSLILGVGTAIYLEEYAKKIALQILFKRTSRT